MNDLHKLLYDMLRQRRQQETKQRIVDKQDNGDELTVTLDYKDQAITNYVILAQNNTIILRYEDNDNKVYQDALQTDRPLQAQSLEHKEADGYLTITAAYQGGNDGKRTHSR